MQADERPLSSSDLERVGQLHVESIDDSLPALLGARYAASLYQYLARSAEEVLFVEFTGERVDSCCVVSLAPDSLYGRIARATWPSLLWHAALALRQRAFRDFLRGAARDAFRATPGTSKTPEITYIFTNQNVRGRGLGRVLIERVDAHLREAGFGSYFVKTLDEPGTVSYTHLTLPTKA